MLASMSAMEFAEWRVFAGMEPIGHERGDMQAGVIASVIANCHRGKRRRPFSITDFMPFFAKPDRADPAALSRSLRAAFESFTRRRDDRQD